MRRDLYQVLGVHPRASRDQIKTAYRRLAKKHHPDRNPGREAKSRMQEINQAYAVLGDPEQRMRYDQWLAMARQSQPDPTHRRPPDTARERYRQHNAGSRYPPPGPGPQHRRSPPPRRARRGVRYARRPKIGVPFQSWYWPLIFMAAANCLGSSVSSILKRAPVRQLVTALPPTAPATAVPESLWTLAEAEDFIPTQAGDWDSGRILLEHASFNARIDGTYHWEGRAREHAVVWALAPEAAAWETSGDFRLSVDCRQIQGPEVAVMGLVFRSFGGNPYVFKLRNDQHYAVSLMFADGGEWLRLTPWTPALAIRPNRVNRLTVVGEGRRLTFMINGETVGELEDNRRASGAAGIAIELFNPGDTGTFEFDNLELRRPAVPGSMPSAVLLETSASQFLLPSSR